MHKALTDGLLPDHASLGVLFCNALQELRNQGRGQTANALHHRMNEGWETSSSSGVDCNWDMLSQPSQQRSLIFPPVALIPWKLIYIDHNKNITTTELQVIHWHSSGEMDSIWEWLESKTDSTINRQSNIYN